AELVGGGGGDPGFCAEEIGEAEAQDRVRIKQHAAAEYADERQRVGFRGCEPEPVPAHRGGFEPRAVNQIPNRCEKIAHGRMTSDMLASGRLMYVSGRSRRSPLRRYSAGARSK